MHWGHGWGMGWAMLWWWAFWLLVVVAATWLLLKRSGRPDGESPESILKRRYARGEIDRQEYEQRLSDLRK